jgi:hypothetical protein
VFLTCSDPYKLSLMTTMGSHRRHVCISLQGFMDPLECFWGAPGLSSLSRGSLRA